MNKAYKVIWSSKHNTWIAVGELAKSKGGCTSIAVKSKSTHARNHKPRLRSTLRTLIAQMITATSAFVVFDANCPISGVSLLKRRLRSTTALVSACSGTALRVFLLSAGLSTLATAAHADTTTWINSGTGDWVIGANWDSGVPFPSDSANIDDGTAVFSGGDLGSTGTLRVGGSAATTGTVTVDGAGSTLWIDTSAWIGYIGTGFLNVTDGGLVDATGLDIYVGGNSYSLGDNSGSDGTINIDGATSTLSAHDIVLGEEGPGHLNISNGGTANTDGDAIFGTYVGGSGFASVDGAGSNWNVGGNIYVALEGDGELTLSDGGVLTANSGTGTVYVASNAGSVGTINIGAAAGDAAAAAGSLDADIITFGVGDGTLNFNHTETDYDFIADISGPASGYGTITLTGGTTGFSGDMSGYYGKLEVYGGTLSVADGETVHNGTGFVGVEAGKTGTALVDGSTANWTNTSYLHVGDYGTGNVTVSNGGYLSSTDAYLGFQTSGNGTVTVTGTGSDWDVNGDLHVGFLGVGELNIADGGTVSSGIFAFLGYYAGASGDVTVTGAGSSWSTSDNVFVGYGGDGTLTLSDSGTVTANGGSGTIRLGVNAGTTGTLNIGAAAGDAATGAGVLNATAVTFGSGTGTLVFNHTDTGYSFGANISGAGDVDVYSGTTTLTGTNTYTGDTTVNDGTLIITGSTTGGGSTSVENGTLSVASGGTLSDSIGYIGYTAGTNGSATVTGAGSSWDNSSDYYVGLFGSGDLTVSDGGTVTDATGYIGYNTLTTGTATITGTGSNWTNSSNLFIGRGGIGDLTISDGGTVTDATGYIGYASSSTGTVTVTGVGSQWINSSAISVGRDGTGSLTISDGGTVQSSNIGFIGYGAGSSGDVTVTGTGSVWTNSGDIIVGNNGDGTLTLSDGGTVNVNGGSGTVQLAVNAGTTGTLNIGAAAGDTATGAGILNAAAVTFGSGTDSIVFNHTDTGYSFGADISGVGGVQVYSGTTTLTGTNTFSGSSTVYDGTLIVTGSTTGLSATRVDDGALIVESGGILSDVDGIIGDTSGTSGTVTVTGSGSSWSNSFDLYIGDAGDGTLTVSAGGQVTSRTGVIGNLASSTSVVTVTGSGSSWSNSGVMYVGLEGDGVLNISDGGAVSSALLGYIGYEDTSTGSVTVTGSGSVWNTGTMWIGQYGNATLTIENGGVFNSDTASIALSSGSKGDVTVTGPGSEWNNTYDLSVGGDGEAILTIADGGLLSSAGGKIGRGTGSGEVVVTGSGSQWVNSDKLYVGDGASGALTIADGGVVSNTDGLVGLYYGDTGIVSVSGSGSSWISSGNVRIGQTGNGTLTIADGGAVEVDSGSGTLELALNSSARGTLNIGAAASDAAAAAGTLSAGSIVFGSGTGTINFNHTETAYDFDVSMSGHGTINQIAGVTNLTANNSFFTGTTNVSGGTLKVDGSLGGSVNVNGGILSVADAQTLTLGSNYSQTAGALKLGASSNSSFGKLSVAGTATFAADAQIDVDVANVNTLAIGESLSGVISAGVLETSTFTLTDNSALFNFSAVINGNTVNLNIVNGSSVVDSVVATNNTAGLGAAQVFDSLIDGGTTGTDMDNVVTALGKLTTDEDVAQAVSETLPLFLSSNQKIIANNLRTINRSIQFRQSGFTGGSSGDIVLADKHMWVKPVGNWTEQDKRNGVSGYDADSYGFVGGIDGDINDNTKLGFALSYMNSSVDGKDSAAGNSADIDAYQAIVYGSHSLASNMELNWQADVGLNKNEGSHYISFMNRTAQSDYDSYTAHIGAGIGKSIQLNDKTMVVPGIRADYAWIKDQSYSETGAGALNLNVDSNTSDELIVTAQTSISHELNDKASLIADVGLGYDLLNEQASLTASYSGGGASFTTPGINPSPWIGSAGAGINYQISETSEITARYDMEGRSDFLSQTASVKFRWMF